MLVQRVLDCWKGNVKIGGNHFSNLRFVDDNILISRKLLGLVRRLKVVKSIGTQNGYLLRLRNLGHPLRRRKRIDAFEM